MDMETLRKWIAERDSISILETVDVFTGVRSALRKFDFVIEAPNWTRDGKRLLYNSQGSLFTYDLQSGAVQQIDAGFATDCNNDHVLSPDGSQIALSHFTNADATSRIYTLPFAGGTPTLVTEKGPSYLHGWSPDGKRLAYCAERNGQYDIYSIAVEGGEETQLTDLPGLDDGPEYSPDGKFIWFNSTRTGLMQIWRMEADGSNPVQMVAEDANDWFPHVSPYGRWVVYLAYGKNDVNAADHPANKNVEIRIIPAEGGEPRTLTALFSGQGTINVHSWSPDSRSIAFVSYQQKENTP